MNEKFYYRENSVQSGTELLESRNTQMELKNIKRKEKLIKSYSNNFPAYYSFWCGLAGWVVIPGTYKRT